MHTTYTETLNREIDGEIGGVNRGLNELENKPGRVCSIDWIRNESDIQCEVWTPTNASVFFTNPKKQQRFTTTIV